MKLFPLPILFGFSTSIFLITMLSCSSNEIKEEVLPPVTIKEWPAEVNLCTGEPKGNYFQAGEIIKREASRYSLKVNVIPSAGSMENLEKVYNGDCQAGIIQSDALIYWQHNEPEKIKRLMRGGALYREAGHLVCNRKADVEDVTALEDSLYNMFFRSETISLIVSSPQSGHHITLKTWAIKNDNYENIPYVYMTGMDALSAISTGQQAQCLFYMAALKSPFMMEADKMGNNLRLVPINDKSFSKYEFNGLRVYQFVKIPKSVYPGLQSEDTTTLALKAIIIVNTDWIQVANQDSKDALFDAIISSKAKIKEQVQDNLIK